MRIVGRITRRPTRARIRSWKNGLLEASEADMSTQVSVSAPRRYATLFSGRSLCVSPAAIGGLKAPCASTQAATSPALPASEAARPRRPRTRPRQEKRQASRQPSGVARVQRRDQFAARLTDRCTPQRCGVSHGSSLQSDERRKLRRAGRLRSPLAPVRTRKASAAGTRLNRSSIRKPLSRALSARPVAGLPRSRRLRAQSRLRSRHRRRWQCGCWLLDFRVWP